MSQKRTRWPDLSFYQLRLVVAHLPTGDSRLIMQGGEKYPVQCKNLGFSNVNGFWMRRDLRIRTQDLIKEFPRTYIREMSQDEIVRIMRRVGEKPTSAEIKAKVDLAKAIPVGLNYLGQEVLEGSEGRFIRHQTATVTKEEKQPPAVFLRAESDADIELCADGLIHSIVNGRIFREEDISNFAEVIFGKNPEAARIERMHAAIGSALSRKMLLAEFDPSLAGFDFARKLHEGLPPLAPEFAEQITTLPVGMVAQRLIGKDSFTSESTVWIPNVGNGAFISTLRDTNILTRDAQENLGYAADTSHVRFKTVDRVGKHNYGMVNVPFGQLEKPVDKDGLKISRTDHLEIIEALTARAPGGRSVFTFSSLGGHGVVDEDTKRLLSWISARFEIDGLAQLDSTLFGRGSKNNNRFMLSVGKRGSRLFDGQESLKVIYDYDSLWYWADTVTLGREQAEENRRKALEENSLQSPYIPSSRVSEPKAMIPRNLVGPTREALAAVEAKVGDIDQFVANELGYDVEDLGAYLDAEQVDAVAMAIDAMKRNRGFIEADQTGLGKGRVLAAMTRWAILNGQKVVFVTEKPNLFSDFFRDLVDIKTDGMVKHRMVNQNTSIRLNGQRLHGPSKSEDIKAMVNSMAIPDDINLVMATYAQFNRAVDYSDDAGKNYGSQKAKWLHKAVDGAMLILDESHNAAGSNSNTGVNISAAVASSENTVYSSATFAKGAKNFSVYSKVMPARLKSMDMGSVLEAGGEPLMEVFSADLAADGVLIRREHDMSDLQFVVEVNDRQMDRNKKLADQLAEILESMGVMSGEISTFVNAKNRALKAARGVSKGSGVKSAKRIGFSAVNFGGRLFQLQRQGELAIQVDHVAYLALQDLAEGRKPVIVLEQTNESLLREAILRQEEMMELAREQDESSDEVAEEDETLDLLAELDEFKDERVLETPLTFRDVLRKSLERMCIIKEVTPTTTITERLEIDSVVRFRESIALLIDAFPDLPISPIDAIKQKIEDAGYTMAEISGRGMGVIDNVDGTQSAVPVRGGDKVKIIEEFNDGTYDGAILTTSGSTGVSLHSSKTFRDQRQRVLIEAQISNDVATRMQFYGRVNRKGQVCPPIIRSATSGLPAQYRLLSMQNKKMRAMSANTTSNQDSMALSVKVPDLLNDVGGEVCRRYMLQEIGITKRLAIEMRKLSDEHAKNISLTWYADQLTGRLGMLPVDKQYEIYEEIGKAYDDEIAALEARGVNPLKTSEMDLKARIVDRQILQGASGGDSVFDLPVYLTTIEYEVTVSTRTSTDIRLEIDRSLGEMRQDERLAGKLPIGNLFLPYRQLLQALRDKKLEEAIIGEYGSVREALDANGNNVIKSINKRFENIIDNLDMLMPGRSIIINTLMGELEGVITRVNLPPEGREHLLGEYDIRIEVPGEGRYDYTLNSLINMQARVTYRADTVIAKFNSIGDRTNTVRRRIMDGNMLMAAQKALTEGFGTSAIYTDENGIRQRGIVLPKSLNANDLLNNSGNNVGIGTNFLKEVLRDPAFHNVRLGNSYYNVSVKPFSMVTADGISYQVSIMNDGATGSVLLNNQPFMSLISGLTRVGKHVTGEIHVSNIDAAMERFYKAGFMLYAPKSHEPQISAIKWEVEEKQLKSRKMSM